MIHFQKNEKILLVVRKHWTIYLIEGVSVLGFIAIPFAIAVFTPLVSSISFSGDYFLLYIFFSSLWLLLAWNIFFVIWTNNYLDIVIVTNRRVIDIEQIGLFHRDVSSFYLNKIEDITVETRGFFGTLLRFGNLHIQTAGEDRELRLDHISSPEKTRRLISNTQRKFKG